MLHSYFVASFFSFVISFRVIYGTQFLRQNHDPGSGAADHHPDPGRHVDLERDGGDMNTAFVAIAGVLTGILLTLFVWRMVNTETRLRKLEAGQTEPKRLTYWQLEKLEEANFVLGQIKAIREQQDEIREQENLGMELLNTRLEALLNDGPNGDRPKKFTKKRLQI